MRCQVDRVVCKNFWRGTLAWLLGIFRATPLHVGRARQLWLIVAVGSTPTFHDVGIDWPIRSREIPSFVFLVSMVWFLSQTHSILHVGPVPTGQIRLARKLPNIALDSMLTLNVLHSNNRGHKRRRIGRIIQRRFSRVYLRGNRIEQPKQDNY